MQEIQPVSPISGHDKPQPSMSKQASEQDKLAFQRELGNEGATEKELSTTEKFATMMNQFALNQSLRTVNRLRSQLKENR